MYVVQITELISGDITGIIGTFEDEDRADAWLKLNQQQGYSYLITQLILPEDIPQWRVDLKVQLVSPLTLMMPVNYRRRLAECLDTVDALAASITENGIIEALIVRENDNVVLSGVLRLVAAKKLRLDTVPVVYYRRVFICTCGKPSMQHECPYERDVKGSKKLCACCPECTQECLNDI